ELAAASGTASFEAIARQIGDMGLDAIGGKVGGRIGLRSCERGSEHGSNEEQEQSVCHGMSLLGNRGVCGASARRMTVRARHCIGCPFKWRSTQDRCDPPRVWC